MQRHEMIEAFAQLGLKGMAGAFDETVTTGLQRNRPAMEILADLLKAETNHRQAASIRYRLTAAKLPVMKDLAAFSFEGSPINEGLVRSLYDGAFLANHRNIVLVGGTGTDSLYGDAGDDGFDLNSVTNVAGWIVDGGADNDGPQLSAQRIGQAAAGAQYALRGAIQAGPSPQTTNNVCHEKPLESDGMIL